MEQAEIASTLGVTVAVVAEVAARPTLEALGIQDQPELQEAQQLTKLEQLEVQAVQA